MSLAASARSAPAHPVVLSLATLALLPVCALVYLVDPAGSSLYPLCPFYAATGLYCPVCGSLRATNRLLHGDVASAFGFNPLLLLALPVIAYAYASVVLRAWRGEGLPRLRVGPPAAWGLALFVALFAVLRNTELGAFEWMAP